MKTFKWDWERKPEDLDPYECWMVESNLKTISSGAMTADQIITSLKANGYLKVGNAVEQILKERQEKNKKFVARMIEVYTEMFGAPDKKMIAAIEHRVEIVTGRPEDPTPDKIVQVLERMGWPI